MSFENTAQALAALREWEQTMAAYGHAEGVLYLDATTVAPKDTWEGRGKTMEILSKITYELSTDPKNGEIISYLENHADELDPQARREVEVARKQFDQTRRVPAEEYIAYSVLLNEAQNVWAEAKNNNDFASFAPCLEKIVEANRKFAGYYNPNMAPYDALLNEYERGMTMEKLDLFFGTLRERLVPVIREIGQQPQIDDSFLHKVYPIEDQRKFSDYLMEVLGMDRNHSTIGETEHPFTLNFSSQDVRITTHYTETELAFSMYSVIHEGGHALYELGVNPAYDYNCLAGGVSMGVHESQSRFYENLIGRSLPFIQAIYPRVQGFFPEQLKDVTAEQFYKAVNKAEPSLIRTEADELTYCFHVMIRYEIEKQLIGGTLEVKDVPAVWNALYKEYLGVDVPDDKHGCLQDSHWSGGSFGYFPSYALGSAYGAQMLRNMEQEIDVWGNVAKGDLSPITAWLKEKVHKYGCLLEPGDIVQQACGDFDPTVYTDYLEDKFRRLYNLK